MCTLTDNLKCNHTHDLAMHVEEIAIIKLLLATNISLKELANIEVYV